jgi:hypothetical protein|uniref:Uncharacterized protein n=1 Tax=Leptospirillum ferrodiazotrophum TaxID=412449 RepID=C6I087_9BACT|nr:MAG: conserved hypothetical protein [Leptospirillum ferrodiazotrophum]
MAESLPPIPVESIASRIFLVRGQKVMLDSDLAGRRNIDRFPSDFMLDDRF